MYNSTLLFVGSFLVLWWEAIALFEALSISDRPLVAAAELAVMFLWGGEGRGHVCYKQI